MRIISRRRFNMTMAAVLASAMTGRAQKPGGADMGRSAESKPRAIDEGMFVKINGEKHYLLRYHKT